MVEQSGKNNVPSKETSSESKVERLTRESQEHLESIRELAEMDFFSKGDRYGFEQFTGEFLWSSFSEEELKQYLKGMGENLGVNLINIREEEVIRREFQEGVKGERTEKGADVTILKTKDEMFEIQVMKYKNPELGTHYDIIRAK